MTTERAPFGGSLGTRGAQGWGSLPTVVDLDHLPGPSAWLLGLWQSVAVWLFFTLACQPTAPPLPQGSWVLQADQAHGQLVVDSEGCRIGIWSPELSTGGPGLRACSALYDEKATWIQVPFRSGSGEGQAALQWQVQTLVLPLGARDGEFELRLQMTPGALLESERLLFADQAEGSLLAWEDAWAAGRFRLQSGETLVGDIHFQGEQLPVLALYDPSWMTSGLIPSSQVLLDGPDWVLRLPIMPSLDGELGILRINRVLARMVVPFGPEPTDVDRVLALVPGSVTQAERDAAVQAAWIEGGRREQELVPALLAQAYAEKACPLPLAPDSAALLQGYSLTASPLAEGCEILVEPTQVQHGRRLSARIGPKGVRAMILREVPLDFEYVED